jgi:hypothetical protein
MRILATISDMTRLGIVLDVESGETTPIPVRPEFIEPTVEGRPSCRPFGITWSADELFIANNRQLLVFDKQLDFLCISATRLQINVHQLAYMGERVWAVSPWTNSLIGVSPNAGVTALEFDLACHELRTYVHREAYEIDDKWHFNSLLWADGYLFVAAHTFGHVSFINRYNAATLRLDDVQGQVGSSIHGLARHRGELFWISTKTGEIRSDTGYCHLLSRSGYARGFAVTDQYFIVATSEYLGRGERHAGDSWIQLIDRKDGILLHEVHLPDTGSINDIRVLDEYDYAHCVDPFWSNA